MRLVRYLLRINLLCVTLWRKKKKLVLILQLDLNLEVISTACKRLVKTEKALTYVSVLPEVSYKYSIVCPTDRGKCFYMPYILKSNMLFKNDFTSDI